MTSLRHTHAHTPCAGQQLPPHSFLGTATHRGKTEEQKGTRVGRIDAPRATRAPNVEAGGLPARQNLLGFTFLMRVYVPLLAWVLRRLCEVVPRVPVLSPVLFFCVSVRACIDRSPHAAGPPFPFLFMPARWGVPVLVVVGGTSTSTSGARYSLYDECRLRIASTFPFASPSCFSFLRLLLAVVLP